LVTTEAEVLVAQAAMSDLKRRSFVA
jgi:hypothetical protein